MALGFKSKHKLVIGSWKHEELILNVIHGTTAALPRMPTLSCKKLLEALSSLLGLGGFTLDEQQQVLEELRPHFVDSQEETHAFDRLMEEVRSSDAVEHVHQILEEHLDAPSASGPAIQNSSSTPVSGLAFPSLFPLGSGHFESPRPFSIPWHQWGRALEQFYDGRFATHGTFPYFILNTQHRQQAFDDAALFAHKGPHDPNLKVGDLEQLARGQKVNTFKKLSAFASHTQNSDGYWKKQKVCAVFMFVDDEMLMCFLCAARFIGSS